MEFVTKRPFVNSTTKVVSVTIGAKEVDGEYSAAIEKSVDIAAAEQKSLGEWTEAELTTLCNDTATADGWQALLDAQIADQKDEPVASDFTF